MDSSARYILHKPFTSFEEENASRKLTGYNVFISNYVREFRKMDDTVKWKHVHSCHGYNASHIIGEWIHPDMDEVRNLAGLLEIEEYIRRRKEKISEYANESSRMFGICKKLEMSRAKYWWSGM